MKNIIIYIPEQIIKKAPSAELKPDQNRPGQAPAL